MKLKNFVTFYRLNNKPSFCGNKTVELDCDCSEENVDLIKAMAVDGIDIVSICIDGDDIEPDNLEPGSMAIELELQIPTNGEFDAYSSLSEMIEDAKTLLVGEYPSEFYIIDDDFYSSEQMELPSKYQNLFNICSIINGLGELAHYHDAKEHDGMSNNFVFLDESEIITSKPVIMKPAITIDLLNGPILDVALIESFHDPKEKVSPTVGKEKALFRVSIIEFVGQLKHFSQRELFVYLVANWPDFLKCYQRNLETYLSGFSFHKARKEVADEEFKVAEQYSKVLGDIAGKLFGLPVSFVALLGLFKSDVTFSIEFVVFISLVTASWLMSNLVKNQMGQLNRIDHAKGIAFDALENQKSSYPVDLQSKLSEVVTALNNEYQRLDKLLRRLAYVIWTPVIIVIMVIGAKYIGIVIEWLHSISM